MSQENAEIVRRAYEALNTRDVDAVSDSGIPMSSPASRRRELSPSRRARDGLRPSARQWDDSAVELKKLIDAGGEAVGDTPHHGTGRASGAAVEAHVAYVFVVEYGTLIRQLNTEAQALEAVGRRE